MTDPPGPLDHLLALSADELAERAVSLGLPPDAFTPRLLAGLIRRIDASGGPDACWPWTGARQGSGYGVADVAETTRGAHRLVYVLAVGPLPGLRLQVRHDCDNPPCCNPAHLRPGTPAQNAADTTQRGRRRQGAVLTADEAEFIPRLIERTLQASRRRKRPMTRPQLFAMAADIFDISTSRAGTLYDRARAEARAGTPSATADD